MKYSLRKETDNNYILESDEVIVDLCKIDFSYINDFVNLNGHCILTLKGENEAYLQVNDNSEIITISPIINFKSVKREIVFHFTKEEYIPELLNVLRGN